MGVHPSFLHSSMGQSDTQARHRENVPMGILVAVPPRCYVGLRRAPLPAAQWLLCAQNLHLSPHGLEQKSPLWSPQGPERKLGGQSQQPRPPCLVSLWFTLVSSPSLDSRCGSGEVVLEMGTVGN